MKRTFTLVVLLGLMMGAMLTGCNSGGTGSTSSTDTNAPVTSTNK